jgi:hypothetical protein
MNSPQNVLCTVGCTHAPDHFLACFLCDRSACLCSIHGSKTSPVCSACWQRPPLVLPKRKTGPLQSQRARQSVKPALGYQSKVNKGYAQERSPVNRETLNIPPEARKETAAQPSNGEASFFAHAEVLTALHRLMVGPTANDSDAPYQVVGLTPEECAAVFRACARFEGRQP